MQSVELTAGTYMYGSKRPPLDDGGDAAKDNDTSGNDHYDDGSCVDDYYKS